MGQVLYRKYRPKKLDDVYGQEQITSTLKQALASGLISHAYLFTGPRGVGKTSVARIMAHQVNGLEYSDETSHIDIIEIDAASNRRIDEISDLRDKVYIAPVSAKYKVYIIDEVHMLTKEAFNALLKTLEEPPAHVVFILATTDAHKLPETIISRTQRYNFKPISEAAIEADLSSIAKEEKLKITAEAIKLIAKHGQGSLRDSISLLDQARSYATNIDEVIVRQMLGLPTEESLSKLIDLTLNNSNSAELLDYLNKLIESGYSSETLASLLVEYLKEQLLSGQAKERETNLRLMQDLINLPLSVYPDKMLEVILLRYQPLQPIEQPAVIQTNDIESAAEPQPEAPPDYSAASDPAMDEAISPVTDVKSAQLSTNDAAVWSEVLKKIKLQHNTLYSVIKMASPTFDGNHLTLTFGFAFHKKKLEEAANKQLLMNYLKEITNQDIKVDCVLNQDAPAEIKPPKPVINPEITAISNIFNGAELLES